MLIRRSASVNDFFDPSPLQCLPHVGEGAHGSGLAAAERVDIRQTPFMPLGAVFQSTGKLMCGIEKFRPPNDHPKHYGNKCNDD
jgi:hypothetical protein